eukprot:SAG11_NODE_7121_length_1189_cov_231.339450_2_plen_159_part_01
MVFKRHSPVVTTFASGARVPTLQTPSPCYAVTRSRRPSHHSSHHQALRSCTSPWRRSRCPSPRLGCLGCLRSNTSSGYHWQREAVDDVPRVEHRTGAQRPTATADHDDAILIRIISLRPANAAANPWTHPGAHRFHEILETDFGLCKARGTDKMLDSVG